MEGAKRGLGRILRAALAVALVAATAGVPDLSGSSLAADGLRFRHRDLYRTASQPAAIAVADLTGDGLQDVVMTAAPDQRTDPPNGKHELLMFEQGPIGLFGVPERFPIDWGIELGLDTGDVTADGRADVVVATGHSIYIFMQVQGGGLGQPTVLTDVADGEHVEVADLNEDGWGDIVVQARDGIYLLRNDAETFLEMPVSPLPMRDVAVAEVTGDDRLDILSTRENAVHVFEQVAENTFVPGESYQGTSRGETANPLQIWSFSVGDMSGDERADIIMAVDEGGSTDRTTLNVLRQIEGGAFAEATTKPIANAPWSIAIANVDRAGYNDVIVAHSQDHGVGTLRSFRRGLGNEQLTKIPTTHGNDRGVAVARVGGSSLGIVNAAAGRGLSILRNPPKPSPLVTTPARELRPFLGSGYLTWTAARKGRPGATDAFVRAPNGRIRKVNRPGTQGWSGGISGKRSAYQEIDRGDSDIRYYNVESGARSAPRGVNTARGWEYGPSLSGNYLMFGRSDRLGIYAALDIFVIDQSDPIDEYRVGGTYDRRSDAITGQVSGEYSVWTECVRVCNVFRHRFSEYDGYKVANPLERVQYAPAVASDGTVFYAQSGFGCGNKVRLLMRSPGERPRLVLRLPRGIDVFNSSIGRDESGREMLVFDRLNCRTQQWDIYGL